PSILRASFFVGLTVTTTGSNTVTLQPSLASNPMTDPWLAFTFWTTTNTGLVVPRANKSDEGTTVALVRAVTTIDCSPPGAWTRNVTVTGGTLTTDTTEIVGGGNGHRASLPK